LTPDIPPPAPTAPAAKARKTGRRTRRDLLGLVAGVITATSVIVFVLAAAAGALFVSGVVPLTGLQHYVAADLQKRLGDGWTVFTSKAAIVRRDGHAALEIQNAEFRHSSGLRIKAPDAHVRYNPWSLLRGGVDISSVDIHGVNLRLQVDASGALTLDAGEGALPLAKAAVPQTPEQANLGVIEQAGGIIGTLLEKDGILPGLDRIALTGARLILVAPDGRERVGLENVAIHLDRTADGRALRLSGQSQSGPKDIIFSRKPHGDSGRPPCLSAAPQPSEPYVDRCGQTHPLQGCGSRGRPGLDPDPVQAGILGDGISLGSVADPLHLQSGDENSPPGDGSSSADNNL
jgi:hypothetical protein